ncbi:copper homeostasis protein CutC, partial [Streptomyces sp. NPDC059597]|uniref:copper homeostasis protein CutC n=1 Tax=Streptomyces sp. NPDC059597 TaxID=3346879 RepID=UPI0036C45C47
MSERAVLEVIALDVEDAVAAQAGGADRLELVTEMAADGLTPAPAVVAAIRDAVGIDLRVMLRLTDGFAAGDVEHLVEMAGELREAGADQFVLGFLDPVGDVDLAAVERGGGGAPARPPVEAPPPPPPPPPAPPRPP